MQINENTNGNTSETYESTKIRENVSSRFNEQTIEEYVGIKYSQDVKECLDILDIGYHVTAIGILGRALEQCTKEFCECVIKNKNAFRVNTANLPISSIREKFWGNDGTQDHRLKLLNQQEVIKKGGNRFQLKKILLKRESYFVLDAIKDARNKAFHGCSSDDEFNELSSKSRLLIEWGINILITLVGEIRKGR